MEETLSKATETVTASVEEILNLSLGAFTLGKLISAVITFLVCMIVIRIVMRFVSGISEKIPADKRLSRLFNGAVKAVLYFLAIVITTDTLGIPVTSLLAVFSVAGLAVSLALQGLLGNIASGIVLLLTKAFVVGDYIEVGGVSGTAQEIGLIYTRIYTVDNKVISVPNSDISAARIINYSAEQKRRIDLTFSASYEASTASVKEAILETIDSIPTLLRDEEPFVHISAYGESNIDYSVRVWAKTADYWNAYYELMEGVRESFNRHGIEMSYNQLNVHVEQTDK